jgi:hypothetical protein
MIFSKVVKPIFFYLIFYENLNVVHPTISVPLSPSHFKCASMEKSGGPSLSHCSWQLHRQLHKLSEK